jgi:hypothetical protein
MKHEYKIKNDVPECKNCGKIAELTDSIKTLGDNDKTVCKPVKRGKFGLPL